MLGSFFQAYGKKPEAVFVRFLKVLSNFARNSEVSNLSICLTIGTCGIGIFIQVKTQAILFSEGKTIFRYMYLLVLPKKIYVSQLIQFFGALGPSITMEYVTVKIVLEKSVLSLPFLVNIVCNLLK